jgi:putative component of membrane protein insertase Oxa1/YidC/SpoIIIJ protein YidD
VNRLLLTLISAYRRWISPGLPRRCPTTELPVYAMTGPALRARGALPAAGARCAATVLKWQPTVPERFTLRVKPIDRPTTTVR